jgi:hypothetical protein
MEPCAKKSRRYAFKGVYDSSGWSSIWGMTADSRKIPERAEVQRSVMVTKLSPWPERATKADRACGAGSVGRNTKGAITTESPGLLWAVPGACPLDLLVTTSSLIGSWLPTRMLVKGNC